ncbi:hypothetical protein BGZ97_011184 [Linnemannia gamsii]|uniref:Uncharacterized protein n=1 Tax=Linnemannia gamsii TaxID=64522 RepID=A0A9P6UN88_9FUNG|nr:hypothetical protein BGZ97_011184 [Linnemannia gamsii]
MNTCQAFPQPFQLASNPPSISSTLGLDNDELRRINGPIPSTRDHICEAIEKMENMHLDIFAEGQTPLYRTQPLATMNLTETRKSRTESPRVHPQGPRSKPASEPASVATTPSRHRSGDFEDRIRLYECCSPSDYLQGFVTMDSVLPPPYRLELVDSPPQAYVRVKEDLQSVNRSLNSWLVDPRHHPHYDQQY